MAEDETFKVTDRRGRDPGDEASSSATQAAPSAPRPHVAPTGAASPGPAGPPPGGADLRGLFLMLASTALVNLGEAADPGSGERAIDLEQAKEAIDLLSLLRAKTDGNRTEQESHLLEEILYDLQLRFVRAATGAGAGG